MSDAAFDPARWRPASFLPEKDARDPALIFVIAVLSFLACLTAMGVIAANRAANGWAGQLIGEATVIVRTRGGESPDAAAARAAEVLAGVRGVTEARALEREKAYALIRPWLGDVEDLDDLPVPRLVAVTLDARTPATAATLDRALKSQGIDAVIDDHRVWIKDIRRAAGVVRWTGSGVFLLIALAAGGVVAFATRAGLAARRDVVEVLHLTGAEDSYIAGLFEFRFARIAAAAGAIGALAAGLLAALMRVIGGGQGITPALPIAWTDLLAVLPCPLIAALVAAVAARLTARALIRGLE
jgi:cell division transport system permease protein